MDRSTKRDAWRDHLQDVRDPSALFSGSADQGILRLLTLGGALPYRSAAAGLTIREKLLVQHLLGRAAITLDAPGGPDFDTCDVLVAHSSLGKLTLHDRGPQDPADPQDVVAGLRLPAWLREMVDEETRAEESLEQRERAELDAMLAHWRAAGTLAARLEEVIDWVERVETVFVHVGRRVFSRSDSGSSTLIRGNALPVLRERELDAWSPEERLFVAAMQILFRTGRAVRFEEFNGRQLTATALRTTLLRRCSSYYESTDTAAPPELCTMRLQDLAATAGELLPVVDAGPGVRYRRINGLSYAKDEFVMDWDTAGRQVDLVPPTLAALAARHLGAEPPTAAGAAPEETAPALVRRLTARAAEIAALKGDTAPLEEVLQAIVLGATIATGGDYAMSSGIRDLTRMAGGDVAPVLELKKPDFFCCALAGPTMAAELPAERISDILWQVAQRMMYNRWHFVPGNYARDDIPLRRHYFFPPNVPDIGEWGDLRHGGHTTSQVRYTLRAPGAAMWMPGFAPYGHPYRGCYDIRVVRMEGPPFTLEDLRAASRYSDLVDVFWRELARRARTDGGFTGPQVNAFDADWYREHRWREALGSPGLLPTGEGATGGIVRQRTAPQAAPADAASHRDMVTR
ncbi:hypothetical protein [Kitasatospora sp. NBC_00315]|uniref:hypothetical protein n=1 Tax=Kitasatospora sp. NBC_00315 TaxID=2975963 RepID=UPI003243BA9F